MPGGGCATPDDAAIGSACGCGAGESSTSTNGCVRTRLDEAAKLRLLRLCGGDSDTFVMSQRFVDEVRMTLERGHGATWCAALHAYLEFASPRPNAIQLNQLLDGFDEQLATAVHFWNAQPMRFRQISATRLSLAMSTYTERSHSEEPQQPVRESPRWQLMRRALMSPGARRRDRYKVQVAPSFGFL